MKNKISKLNKQVVIVCITTLLFMACSDNLSQQPTTAKGFSAIEQELKSKFGEDAYYTNLSVIHNETIGNTINVTVAQDPESMKMEEWNVVQNNWKQSSDIVIEVPQGTKATDYMYQLGDNINLTKLGGLVETSTQKLKDMKNLKNPKLSIASIKFPKNGDVSKAEYLVTLEPEHGGTAFSFFYTLDGNLIKMDY
ncbi:MULTISPECIES: hypothetical protein [Flavobacteriaceae]|uniref:Beta-lactamase-inhibitor-like PepSY-like domain-containing protein n=1 Tax=Gaetbulibacter jejuensis TaxID=584607 RepID=A0ABP3V1D5_9FLAO|nr:hypothetical protein [Meridianimaribacter sp. CL38]TBV26642.1 hypothetical protein DMZ43_06145 [Meridianimaribacter sp. CL38]